MERDVGDNTNECARVICVHDAEPTIGQIDGQMQAITKDGAMDTK